jgi:hypothetical protein
MDDSLFSDKPAPDAHLFSDEPAPQEPLTTASGTPIRPQVAKEISATGDLYKPGAEVPPEQRLLNNASAAASGYTMPGAVAGVAKLGMRGAGAAMEAVPFTKNIPQTISDTANDALLKSLGSSAGQVKQMGGIDAAREAAQAGRKAGLDNLFTTDIGRQNALKGTIASEGQKIGNLRTQAGPASSNIYNQVKQALEAKYNPTTPDVLSSQYPQVEKSLNMVKNTANEAIPTNAGIAKGITGLNQYATGEKLRQPVNAMTDVANKLSAANNAEIAQTLGSNKAAKYLDALHTDNGLYHLQPMQARGFTREAVSRTGGPTGLVRAALQKIADLGGYRAMSKGLNMAGEGLTTPLDADRAGMSAIQAYLLAQKKAETTQ